MANLFDALKYYTDTGEMHSISTPAGSSQFPGIAPMVQPYMDGSDAMANLKGSILGFEHVGTNTYIPFKAFITNFVETYSSDWNTEVIFGRHDPVYGYKNTNREISIGWKVPAATLSEAVENLARLQVFLKMLYPGYSATHHSAGPSRTHLVQSPLVRMQFMNMVSRHASGDPGINIKSHHGYRVVGPSTRGTARVRSAISYARQTVGRSGIQGGTPTGLLGAITSVTVNLNLDTDVGVFHGQGAIIPKLIEVDITFAPVHEIPLGWDENGIIRTPGKAGGAQSAAFSDGSSNWPYGINDGETHFQAGLTQDDIDGLINLEREFRDKEADILNAQARYNGLFGRALAKHDAAACAGGRCSNMRASAARGAEDYFNRRGNSETNRRSRGSSADWPYNRDHTGQNNAPWSPGFGTNPQNDYNTANAIRRIRRNKANKK
tara:strand:+ start:1936 stop:3243 length:1308 start_codon:yes stop_codon:yes gene_type:complete